MSGSVVAGCGDVLMALVGGSNVGGGNGDCAVALYGDDGGGNCTPPLLFICS